jgi:hypothetical protein
VATAGLRAPVRRDRVRDSDGESVVVEAQRHLRGAIAVAGRVEKRLLHDPIGGPVDAGGESPRLAFEPHGHRQAARAVLLGQLLDRAHARQWRQVSRGRLVA